MSASPLPGMVSREELAALHARLRAESPDPRFGVFGPDSLTWRTSREGVLFFGAGRALLLQLAHPAVAHAVMQHSAYKSDPLGRFQRTFDGVFGMVFGDLDAALARSRGVHAMHSRVQGHVTEDVGTFARGARYAANQVDALLWVHATLLDTTFLLYEELVGWTSIAERDAAYAESKRFAALFGISEQAVPPDWPAFQAYFQRMVDSDELAVGEAARTLAKDIFAARGLWRRPAYGWLGAVTTSLLPPRIRDAFGHRSTPAQRALASSTLLAARLGRPLLPPTLRYVPAYMHARRRIAGKEGPDRLARAVERIGGTLIAP